MPYKRVIIIPYKMGSKSARALKDALVAKHIRCFRKRSDSGYIPRRTDLLIYYGGTETLPNSHFPCKNYVRNIAQNKLQTLRVLVDQGLSCIDWTTSKEEASAWGTQVVVRHTLTGHSGQGIEVVEPGLPLPNAPLYTKYYKKTYECRIHVFNGVVIDGQIKRKRAGQDEPTNNLVRNVHTGWVYCREGFVPDDRCKALAISAVAAVELDFGAVDIIYNQHYNEYRILEINTAPGLEGQTLTNYVEAIQNVL